MHEQSIRVDDALFSNDDLSERNDAFVILHGEARIVFVYYAVKEAPKQGVIKRATIQAPRPMRSA